MILFCGFGSKSAVVSSVKDYQFCPEHLFIVYLNAFNVMFGSRSIKTANTGMVLDVQMYSKHCRCVNRLQEHHEPNSVANYEGASGGMEVKGAIEMLCRSVPEYNNCTISGTNTIWVMVIVLRIPV